MPNNYFPRIAVVERDTRNGTEDLDTIGVVADAKDAFGVHEPCWINLRIGHAEGLERRHEPLRYLDPRSDPDVHVLRRAGVAMVGHGLPADESGTLWVTQRRDR
jgi:hypothetical protein